MPTIERLQNEIAQKCADGKKGKLYERQSCVIQTLRSINISTPV
jgi:hypothetical protein